MKFPATEKLDYMRPEIKNNIIPFPINYVLKLLVPNLSRKKINTTIRKTFHSQRKSCSRVFERF